MQELEHGLGLAPSEHRNSRFRCLHQEVRFLKSSVPREAVLALTDKEILALNPKEKRYKIFDGDGLYLLVLPKGRKILVHEVSYRRPAA